jgi:hypothetical protein
VRENKGGKGARGIMSGSTDTKAGHAGESIGSGGTGKSDKSKLDASPLRMGAAKVLPSRFTTPRLSPPEPEISLSLL